ncbi:PEP-CTERM sorting domain-containing protein [Methylophilus sp.]|jgi:hypothetical protein|uniref:PEP-CTERM sorting domain-containing protein n=1 Tax=Methylophilus sp. TaxID=29541 RepID=UPI0011D8D73D|nr:PEP-CTERM sorting domain-containing protein [Methylophilus sp.]TXI44103.1 MAG: PEP-CTERM sorting domain-containing protein [Methylophilus sp.]
MLISRFAKTVVGLALMVGMSAVNAANYTFVGSWSVYNSAAPLWSDSAYDDTNGPLAYTAQEAAALLFGGSASDYVISSIDNNPLNIDFKAWYDVLGYESNNTGVLFAQDYNSKYNGAYYGPVGSFIPDNINAAASAFIRDNDVSSVNYAFRITPVPEPESYGLLMAGLGTIVWVRRKKITA